MRYPILFILICAFIIPSFAQDAPSTPEKAEPKKEKNETPKKETVKKTKEAKQEKAEKEKSEAKPSTVTEKTEAPKKEKANPKVVSENAEAPSKEETKIESKSKPPKVKVPYHFMANIHGGIGLMNYFGDIRDKSGTTVHRVGSHPGYNFGIGGNVTNYLDVNVNVLLGKLTWNQNPSTKVTPLNFEAKVFTVGAELVYNFKNVIRNPVGITPFISIGVSYSDYDVYADLQGTDRDGNTWNYNYWDGVENRGLIYNLPQGTANPDDVQTLSRDFEYETRLNEFPISAVTIPIGAGFDFNASRKFAIRLGSYYYFTTNDMIDNVAGGDKGFFSNDGFLYTSLSVIFKFDPFKKKAPKVDVAGPEYGDLSEIENDDSDGDGVTDLLDRCAGTPKGLVVDDNGCPADEDRDGIADYKDKQLKTPAGSVVDPNGVAVSYQDIYKNYGSDTASLARKSVDQDWLFSQKNADPSYTVHVGTYTNYDIPTQIKMRLAKMEGLVETKVNDSISVFTLGKFDNFEAAEKKQNELIESGIDEAFGVNEGAIPDVGVDLGVIGFKSGQEQQALRRASLALEDKDVLSYGVELREYRLRIEIDKLSKLIAQYGVQMKTTEGGMKVYTIGSFKTFAEADALEKQVISLGVKNPAITARFNNQDISIEDAKEKEAIMAPAK
ncbi:MAG: hypothetical protein K9G41_02240 [Flavobacteriales bacterium]|nr:hypothetical protein [Flavobacteriales bacterium]